MIRSATIMLAFVSLVSAAIIAGLSLTTPVVQAAADFRIIDVRAEYGQLVVEVQHFNDDGSHAYYENYTWRGQEQYQQPIFTDQMGNSPIVRQFIKSDGRVAPVRGGEFGGNEHYLPVGEQWLRHNRPHLDDASILRVIQKIHAKRDGTGWNKGQQRLTTHPMDFTQDDAAGAPFLKSRFAGLKETAYEIRDNGTLLAFADTYPVDPFVSSVWGTVTTFHSDGDPEAARFDGDARRNANEDFATIRAGAGTAGAQDAAATDRAQLLSTTTTDEYSRLRRGFALFDTSGLPDGDTVSAVDYDFVATTVKDEFTGTHFFNIVATTPASDTAIEDADYSQTGSVKFATDISILGITADSSTFTSLVFIQAGLDAISLTGTTKLGPKLSSDIEGIQTWTSGADEIVLYASAEEILSGDKRPALIVTHSPASAAVTGTIGDGATEQEVRDGGGTIIITLTGSTWNIGGALFNNERQAIIDGLDAAEAESAGWNAQIRDKMGVNSVARTSDTVVTVTIPAVEVQGYQINSPETITVTVPASAQSAGATTATPTFTITAAIESLALTGTLGGSGGTPPEIRAGGETIILTLTNSGWVPSSIFDAQRRLIINGLTSGLDDENGWNRRRGDFAVGDVVRTSGTVVTITLSASLAYAIPATETMGAVAPSTAVGGALPLTAPTGFSIIPSFQSTGNRVTTAVDLSSVTDVAFCAFGWDERIPTNTTVVVATSVDGGAIFTTATNGDCPAGITVGGSLATITDFRARVTLTTTDSSVTPLVYSMALVIQDTTGQALYIQLNDTPGITIADRSANSNVNTMSFPVSLAGIGSTTGILTSTRAVLSAEQVLSAGDVFPGVTGAAVSSNLFNQDETGFATLPFQSYIEAVATGTELPLKFWWIVFAGLGSITLGLAAFFFSHGSLMLGGIGMAAGMGVAAAIGDGLLPGWSAMIAIVIIFSLIVLRNRGALPL